MQEKSEKSHFFLVEDASNFLSAVDDLRDRIIFRLMIFCGLFINEILGSRNCPGISIEHINPKERTIKVTGRDGETRTTILDPTTSDYLQMYVGKRVLGKLFDISERQIERLVRTYILRAGMKALYPKIKPLNLTKSFHHFSILAGRPYQSIILQMGLRKEFPTIFEKYPVGDDNVEARRNVFDRFPIIEKKKE